MDSSRIRVLVTAFAPVPGSSPHAAALLAMTSAVRGDVDLVTVKTELLSHVERIGESRMFRVPVGETGQLEQRVTFDRAVARQLEAERYDIVHVRGPFEGAIAAERKSTYGFQVVYELATFPDEALGTEVEKRWGEAHQKCLQQADVVLVPTAAAARMVADTVAADRVLVLPPGVDVGAYDWSPQPRSSIPRLLYLGAFTSDRDLATLLGAIRRVSSTRPVRALFAGDPDRQRRERLRAMVDAFQLRERVEVRGEPPARSLPQVIAGADLCVAPASEARRFQSLGDLPEPLLEHMACHRPVIVAGVPGVSDVLRDEKEGLLYPPGDENALADAILQMLRDTDLRERTTDAGYRRVRELFSSGARRRRVAEIYEKLAPGSQAVDPWEESFPDEGTGEIALPESSSGPDSRPDTIAPEPDTGETSDVPGEKTGRHHALDLEAEADNRLETFPGVVRLDTDPGSLAPERDDRNRNPDTNPGR